MDELYGGSCHCHHHDSVPVMQLETDFEFSPETLLSAMKDIYGGFDVRNRINKTIYLETLRILKDAMFKGISMSSFRPSGAFIDSIRNNLFVLSAFKTHRMQNDMAARLLDEEGNLKPFEKWEQDIKPIASHYNRNWLQTEYSTAVIRAHNAVDWQQFMAEKDIFPNLRWLKTTSKEPERQHKEYWSIDLTLPKDSPFWKNHFPGDHWNCKCSLMQTDEPASTGDLSTLGRIDKPDNGIDKNPGVDGELFTKSHPYIKEAYPGAEKAVKNFLKRKELETVFSDEVTRKVTKIENEIRMNKNFETGVAVDRDGNILIDKRGENYSVNFTKAEADKAKNCIFTHNHPRGWEYMDTNSWKKIGNSFSPEDMAMAISQNVAEIRAVTPSYTFSMKRPAKGWVLYGEYKYLCNKFDKESDIIFFRLNKMIAKGYLSPDRASIIHFHLLWKRLAKRYGWIYSKLKTR